MPAIGDDLDAARVDVANRCVAVLAEYNARQPRFARMLGDVRMIGIEHEPVRAMAWPQRTDRAAKNMLENLVLFAALALAASVGGVTDPHVELGARIFFWARLAYIPIYMIGVPVARTAVWAISVIGMGLIFASIVQALPPGA